MAVEVLYTIGTLESHEIISPDEASKAIQAESMGAPNHTIGYEFEITEGTRDEIGIPYQIHPRNALVPLQQMGFGFGRDEWFEITSPVAMHPRSLQIALKGLTHHLLCPEKPNGLVTQHVSVGTNAFNSPGNVPIHLLIQALRAVELIGGASTKRLMSPFSDDSGSPYRNYSWNCKGLYGLQVTTNQSMRDWIGSGSRIEFRSLEYMGPAQFAATTDALYYLTRAIFTHNSTLMGIENDFDTWFRDFCEDNRLPTVPPSQSYANTYFHWEHLKSTDDASYIRPYADIIRNGPNATVRQRLASTILNIREELGMTSVNTVFSDFAPSHPTILI